MSEYSSKATASRMAKMKKMGVQGEDAGAKAKRISKYADGGSVDDAKRAMDGAIRRSKTFMDLDDPSQNKGQGPTEATATGMRITGGSFFPKKSK